MPGKGGQVGQHPPLLTPEPYSDHIFMFTTRKSHLTIDAPPRPNHVPRTQVVGEELQGIPSFRCLSCGKKSLLVARDGKQVALVRSAFWRCDHGTNIKYYFIFVR